MSEETNEKQFEKLCILRRKLDKEIGYNYWKKYVASAFWSQVSTPINLTITFLTAITTAQSQTQNFLSQSMYSQIAITSLVITTLNTFFRPHTQYAANTEYLSKWKEIGIEFEKEFFNRMEDESIEAYQTKIENYQTLQEKVDGLRKSEGTDMINFLTDFIYYICYRTCLRRYRRWLDVDRRIIRDSRVEIQNKEINKNKLILEKERITEQLQQEHRIEIAKLKKKEETILFKLEESNITINTPSSEEKNLNYALV
jgi:hypothetical protein